MIDTVMTASTRIRTAAQIVTAENRQSIHAGTPVFFRLATAMAEKVRIGSLIFQLPDGRRLAFVGAESPEPEALIIIKKWSFARRSVLGGDIGFFESYADGDWDSPSITDVLYVFARNADHVGEAFKSAPFFDLADQFRHFLFNRNTRTGSKRNISAHYDLGNAFYEKWLDRTMTYSSAKFSDATGDLSAAQLNKYDALAQAIELRPDATVLEIGSGWGGFAEYAAKTYGAKVTGLTISREQFDYARERIFRQGLAERVAFKLQDYRDERGAYDRVASIEMFEAVGREYWPTYFNRVHDSLKPGGLAGLQIITIADRFFERYSRGVDFIQRYVFPGGMLPSPSVLLSEVRGAGLAWRGATSFGQDYARTLREWQSSFLAAWDEIRPLGFDERFRKLWRFYLSYCEAGFKAATTDVVQVSLARPA